MAKAQGKKAAAAAGGKGAAKKVAAKIKSAAKAVKKKVAPKKAAPAKPAAKKPAPAPKKVAAKKPTTVALPIAAPGAGSEAFGGGPAGAFGAKTAPEVPKGALQDGSVVIAAITSCTNTSNPSVMVGAGLLAKKAVERGLKTPPYVKTSLAPGSRVVTDYLKNAGLLEPLEALKFNVVGYGCTTCIGNSGPLPDEVSAVIREKGLVVCSVLSGNRNFEGRIQQDVRANYLASPPLVVAYALAGRMDLDLTEEPLGEGSDGEPVYLRDIWPSAEEIKRVVGDSVAAEMFARNYAEVFSGDEQWSAVEVPSGDRYTWPDSTYVRQPSFF